MRNLKKFLALVLAMMMTLGLMVTANASVASDFTDAESITDEFTEAVSVLEGLEVFEGYEDGSFKPKNSITRAEVATIVYRLATGDVEGKQADLYKDYQNFKDVKSTDWYAGYVNYCANAEWIKGYGDGTFGPNKSVTGYQAAAMILRAVGYGKNGEFNGAGWQVQTANFSRSLGLLTNVDDTTYANTLNQAAPRELVAEILFQAGLINTVTWTQLYGYTPGSPVQGINVIRGLAWQNFKLDVSDWDVIDDWGRPGYYWYQDKLNDNTAYASGANFNIVATIELDPVLEFDTAWKECDVAHELNISSSRDYDLYVNEDQPITSSTQQYRIEATDTVTNVGGQGRITEFYAAQAHPWNGLYNWSGSRLGNRVVMVDTYLATVTSVTERVLDPAGHVIVPAYLYLDVYDGHAVGASNKTAGYAPSSARNTSEHRASKSTGNWEYVQGDKVLVQGYTNYSDGVKNHAGTIDAINKAAFETNVLRSAVGTDKYTNDTYTAAGYDAQTWTNINVLQKAESKTGKQTVTYWNQGKHTVDGGDLNDAMTLFLDVAGTKTNTTFAWYFDQMGNLIGIDNVPNTINYGVITSIYSAFGQGESSTDGTAKAIANVLYADGSTGTVTIDRFLMSGAWNTGHGTPGAAMIVKDGTVSPVVPAANSTELVPVYDNTDSSMVMTATQRTVATLPNEVADTGWLHVAPVINVNAVENGQNNTANKYFGVLRGNMFKFVASTDGNMTAIEVAGKKDASHASENTGVYEWNYNATAANGTIYKSAGYLTLAGGSADVWLDAGARIMVRTNSDSATVNTYTMDTLPGDVTLVGGSEVDWADPDGDGRAEYVYVVGTSVGTQTYGLFYYNGGAAQWNGVAKNGTLTGWLNGEPTTVTFGNETMFNRVKNSQSYKGHLFALELTNGVVSALLDYNSSNWLLSTVAVGTANANDFNTDFTITRGTPPTPTGFGLGSTNSLNGNPYTANTRAVYLYDVEDTKTLSAGEFHVSYDPSKQIITDGSNTYYLTPYSKVVGLGMSVNQDGAILDYLNKSTKNDVTIVFEKGGAGTAHSIVEIYVATDPNVTPPTTGDSSTLSLAYDQGTRTFTASFVNNSGVNLTGVTAKVYYRMAGSNNEWSLAGTATIGAVANGNSPAATGTVLLAGGLGSTDTYEAYVKVSGTTPTSGDYTKSTLTTPIYIIA